MEVLVFVSVLGFGLALLWALREHQERLIAKRGYTHYIQFSRRWQKKRLTLTMLLLVSTMATSLHSIDRNLFNEKPGDLVCLCADCHARWAPKSKGLWKG